MNRIFKVTEESLRKIGALAFDNGIPCIVNTSGQAYLTEIKPVKRVKLAGFEIADIKPQADIPSNASIYAEWEG